MTDPRDFAGQLQFQTRLTSDSEAIGTMPVQEGILNPFGTVHAGALIWFADVTATTLALQGVKVEGGMAGFPLAINLTAVVLSNTKDGLLTARAGFVKKGRSLIVVRTEVLSEDGRVMLDLTTSHISSK